MNHGENFPSVCSTCEACIKANDKNLNLVNSPSIIYILYVIHTKCSMRTDTERYDYFKVQ